jgi:hypothetical protein
VANAALLSTVEELMPALQQLRLVLFDQFTDLADLLAAKAVAALQADRVEPELCFAVVVFDVDMRRLTTIASVEKNNGPMRSTVGMRPCYPERSNAARSGRC